MRILLTNDDGINAPGLQVAERIARQLSDDILVVAPEHDQSGVAHSLSLNDPLRLRRLDERRYAVKGTPTDCVIMAMRKLLDHPPDLVLSGVNSGQNVAEDITYSGTIAAAMEGAILGVASIALSQCYDFFGGVKTIPWSCAETHAPGVLRRIIDRGVPPNVLVNVNFPPCPPEDVKGVAVTMQGRRCNDLMFIDDRVDGRGHPYHWISFQRGDFVVGAGTDLEALLQCKISVTPLKLDFTDHPTVTDFAAAFEAAS
ncbi:MAG TPA: 5'/3'-nucleotidase SurE [Methylocystis sp.]|nr:5'/3'-nucleotidase SurE [Methylocystis sp.]